MALFLLKFLRFFDLVLGTEIKVPGLPLILYTVLWCTARTPPHNKGQTKN